MRRYRVLWEMEYECDAPADAVRHALADLAGVIAAPADGPNFFEVRDVYSGVGLFVEACDVVDSVDV